jgi:hypothetical protein
MDLYAYLKQEFIDTCDPNHDKLMQSLGQAMLGGTELAPAHIGLAFGDQEFWQHTARRAAELYHLGYFKAIVVSGKPIVSGGTLPEALAMRGELIARGVPEKAILSDDLAMNTQQNIMGARRLTDEKFGPGVVNRVIGIGPKTQSRRFLATMVKNWPEVLPMFSPADNVEGLTNGSWSTLRAQEAGKDDPLHILVGELFKIDRYKKGAAFNYITEPDLEQLNRAIRLARSIPLSWAAEPHVQKIGADSDDALFPEKKDAWPIAAPPSIS